MNGVSCSALAYADDIVLLAPTVQATKDLLKICETFAEDYNVLFNASKSKLIVKGGPVNSKKISPLTFMNGIIDVVENDLHLGNQIGNLIHKDIVLRIVNDFSRRVNMIRSHFKLLPVNIMYELFKSHCMSLYGILLLDYDSLSMKLFYTAWRKGIRCLLHLPYRTHSDLLHLICQDYPIHVQIYRRFIKFIKHMSECNNNLVRVCYEQIIDGSGSAVSNSLSTVAHFYNVGRGHLSEMESSNEPYFETETDENISLATAINELLDTRLFFLTGHHSDSCIDIMTHKDCDTFLELLCTM